MIKADIVKRVAKDLDVKDKDALVVVDGILDSLREVICEFRRLEIRDFGVFQVKRRKHRVGRNPRDKVEYPIPARQVVTFRIGKELKLLDPASEASHSATGVGGGSSDL
jgi:nucleoid DNA-binding protein